MSGFRAKVKPLSGTSWEEVAPQARTIIRAIEKRTKRQPYVRSIYFNKQKIFLSYFWPHLLQKQFPDRVRRLRYLPCGIELIQRSREEPTTKANPNKRGELLHRFVGVAPDGQNFVVQVKEDKKSGKKYFLSVFPYTKTPR